MNTRLQTFLNAENITQAQLADKLGVARASISHILAGRNKPGYDIIESLVINYPQLNIEWLITGKGKMYRSPEKREDSEIKPEEDNAVENLFESSGPETSDAPDVKEIQHEILDDANVPDRKNITRIVIFYDDNTYETARPE